MYFQRILKNGVRVVAQKIEGFRSVSVGIWIGTGSANEVLPEERGVSHFIEHMLFKGTQRRTAQQIAAEMDGMGGILNAFTSKECTCYHARVTDEKLPQTLDLLCDVVFHATLDEGEMQKEKGVVLEEINMVEDTPEDLVHDLLSEAYFGEHPLARPILGTAQSVANMTKKIMQDYMAKQYVPENIVFAAAGGIEFEAFCDLVEKQTEHLKPSGKAPMKYKAFEGAEPRFLTRAKPIEQAHLCLCMPGFCIDDPHLYALNVLNNAFGGSMSSRLFQQIREERGLAYDVYSHPSTYAKNGVFSIYAGVTAAKATEVCELILQEMETLKKEGLSEEEFIRAKEQLKGNYILGLESTSARMNAIGRSMVMTGKVKTAEETLRQIEDVQAEDIQEILPLLFDREKLAGSAVGKIQEDELRAIMG